MTMLIDQSSRFFNTIIYIWEVWKPVATLSIILVIVIWFRILSTKCLINVFNLVMMKMTLVHVIGCTRLATTLCSAVSIQWSFSNTSSIHTTYIGIVRQQSWSLAQDTWCHPKLVNTVTSLPWRTNFLSIHTKE